MGRKISQLTAASSMGNDDVIPIVQSGETKKITKSNTGFEVTSNKVTSLSSSSTNTQYPSAKAVYDQLATKQGTLTPGNNISITNGTISATDTTYNSFVGTDGTTAGTAGLVPAPTVSDTNKYLKSDGTWATVSGGGGASYTAGNNINITNDVISVEGLITGPGYKPLNLVEDGKVYVVSEGSSKFTQEELQNSAYYLFVPDTVGTYKFKVTGKVSNIIPNATIPIYGTCMIDSDYNYDTLGSTNVVYTDQIITITATSEYPGILFNFTNTDEVSPSLFVYDQLAPGVCVEKTGAVMTGQLKVPSLVVRNDDSNPGVATGLNSVAVGFSRATGDYSLSAGSQSVASGYDSFAHGSFARASGDHSHAEGWDTTASGTNSHTEGQLTIASGYASHAEGNATTAQRWAQHTEGQYNVLDTTGADGLAKGSYIHIVGNGTNALRSNAYTLDWQGNGWFSGNVYVGSTSGTNKDAGSKPLSTLSYYDIHSDTRNHLVVKADGCYVVNNSDLADIEKVPNGIYRAKKIGSYNNGTFVWANDFDNDFCLVTDNIIIPLSSTFRGYVDENTIVSR